MATLTIDSFNLAQYKHIVIAKEEIHLEPVNKTAYKTIVMQVGIISKIVTYSIYVKYFNDMYEDSVGQTHTDIQDAITQYNLIKLQ